MSNQWKMVPVEPTDDMIYAIATRAHCGDSGKDIWSEALAWSPMPPAGDVEVLAYECSGSMLPVKSPDASYSQWVRLEDYRAHVTRLTADRDALLAEVESYKQGFFGRMAAKNQIALRKSEAELTKSATTNLFPGDAMKTPRIALEHLSITLLIQDLHTSRLRYAFVRWQNICRRVLCR